MSQPLYIKIVDLINSNNHDQEDAYHAMTFLVALYASHLKIEPYEIHEDLMQQIANVVVSKLRIHNKEKPAEA